MVRMSIGEQCGGDEKRSERSPRAPTDGGQTAVGASLKDLAAHLAALPDADVVELFTARPDLTTPPSASFTALAARAGARPSVEAALAHLDTPRPSSPWARRTPTPWPRRSTWSPRTSPPAWSGSLGSPW